MEGDVNDERKDLPISLAKSRNAAVRFLTSSGLIIQTRKSTSPNEIIKTDIYLLEEERCISANCRIKECLEVSAEPKLYQSSIEFVTIKDADLEFIKGYISRFKITD